MTRISEDQLNRLRARGQLRGSVVFDPPIDVARLGTGQRGRLVRKKVVLRQVTLLPGGLEALVELGFQPRRRSRRAAGLRKFVANMLESGRELPPGIEVRVAWIMKESLLPPGALTK